MKRRKYVLAVLMLAGTMALGGCADNKKSGKDNGDKTAKENVVEGEQIKEGELDFKVEDYVTLGEYKGLSVEYPVPEVLEEDVEYAVQELLEENTEYKEIKDRPAKEGDSVNIDYTGVVDGEAFDGGSDSDYDLVLGSGDFLEDFENSLIGKKTGEVVTFPVEFPEEYFDSEMAGKQAEFTVTINKINEVVVPEYTDGLVKEVTAYKTKEEYEKLLKLIYDLETIEKKEDLNTLKEHYNKPCEICKTNNKNHTFIKENGLYYYEVHHLLEQNILRKKEAPEWYKRFKKIDYDNSSDGLVYTNFNTVNLCPVCHRKIHYGLKKDRKLMLDELLNEKRIRQYKEKVGTENLNKLLDYIYEQYSVKRVEKEFIKN